MPLPTMPAKTLDTTNVPRPIMLIARPEHDGTLTLILDCPGTETLPIELGGGYQDVDQIKTAVMQALTSPAVAEDRLAMLEEALPLVNQLVDAANQMQEEIDGLKGRIHELEHPRARRQEPMRIPRLGELRQPAPPLRQIRNSELDDYGYDRYVQHRDGDAHNNEIGNLEVRRTPAPPARPPRPPQERPPGEPRDLTVREGPRPDFSRGQFEPHMPVGRVSRGPGSPD